MRLPVLALAMAAVPLPLLAHPHVFIDSGVEVIFDDQGRATALRISWTYDSFYSLTLIAERGLDPDADGLLDPAEKAALAGFDMNWDAGFPGDTYALLGNQPLTLSGPSDWTADYHSEKLISTHRRDFAAPIPISDLPLVVQVYDPGYYTAYQITAATILTNAPPGCSAKIYEPDPAKADQALIDALAEYAPGDDVEIDFPAVGANFADETRLTCNAN
ncbi:DUF1007 family protein [Neogemmobacter tilapiae]|uniref:DUF1007 family protein n=1 Tax=Neogemmobacter tilapiae TaxID=875041 RepID=A0A918TFG0_9RHOB|nr:DUF1007 family protein [Gemmobacter tilapiae]GHC44440.1 hypothetical protein GCM10007315_02040 [Gemmobacter tilapiae]